MTLLQSLSVHGGVCKGSRGGEDGPSLLFKSAAPVVVGSEACDRAFLWIRVVSGAETNGCDSGGCGFLWWYRQPRLVWCGSILVDKSLGAAQGWRLGISGRGHCSICPALISRLLECLKLVLGQWVCFFVRGLSGCRPVGGVRRVCGRY
ncbi:4-hydroxy-tetrahydrodipicolinate synthase [Striga asiatica]|uniref:4-hydroxy-tetrahydrodipicolinate synthase n=1 Tax=Striga asiatica TaxID=4170 RepID=A0A5A7REI9_STRAF|nr:4-hydroxy-tetrahydrodipicolinate synthase [Striga asiatica]